MAAVRSVTFGPVPSRRLGRSLGINNIPPKKCVYSCVYCQLGATPARRVERGSFYRAEEFAASVIADVRRVLDRGETIDYLTFVPDGEPTLDLNLGRSIRALKTLKIPVAIITNGSLLWREEVRADLEDADWVSVKIDTVHGALWDRMNCPHHSLALDTVLTGIKRFAAEYEGRLVTETMLIAGMNTGERSLRETAAFISRLQPAVSYLSVPYRPPAEEAIHPPDEATLVEACRLFAQYGNEVKTLFEIEEDSFAASGDAEHDILSIASVHPLRAEVVSRLLELDHADWSLVEDLVERGRLVRTSHQGTVYYRTNLRLNIADANRER